MTQEELIQLMTDIDNNEISTIKSKIQDDMKKSVLQVINQKRKAKSDEVE
jgi:hypothetical protein